MNDCISKQMAIDAVHAEFDECLVWDESGEKIANEVEDILYRVPSAEPARMKGKWCVTPDGRLVCSCCYENPTNRIIVDGNLIYDMTPIRKLMKFCPNCGADMRVRGEENDCK